MGDSKNLAFILRDRYNLKVQRRIFEEKERYINSLGMGGRVPEVQFDYILQIFDSLPNGYVRTIVTILPFPVMIRGEEVKRFEEKVRASFKDIFVDKK